MSSKIFIPLAEPDLGGNEELYLSQCIRTGWVSSAGPFVTELEDRLRALSGRAFAVATSSGTTALQLLLTVAGVGRADRVIVPDWTFAASINAVIHAGATPVLVDVSPDTWSLDPVLVNLELTEAHAKGLPIKAVIAVDALGIPADFHALAEVCERHGVALLEDAAGSIGSRLDGRPAGGFGDGAIFSFNGNKLVTAGGGGALLTDHANWAHRARHLSTQARVGQRYEHDAAGYNFRLTNVNAAIAVAQLERLDHFIEVRRAAARLYTDAIAGRTDLSVPPVPADVEWNGWMYAVRTQSSIDAEDLTGHLEALGIGARPFWTALSLQEPYCDFPRRLVGASHALSGALVSLPSGSTLSVADRAYIARSLASWRA